MGKLVQYFSGRNYRSAEEVLQHCEQLTPRILKAVVPRKPSRLGSLSAAVLNASKELGDKYTHQELQAKVEGDLGPLSKRRFYYTVKNLRHRGLLLTKPTFLPGRPPLRKATSSNLAPFMPLVDRVLYGKVGTKINRLRRGNWRDYMSEGDARSAVLHGLRMAYERATDPSHPAFSTYAAMRMAGEIGTAVRGELRRRKRERKFAGLVKEKAKRVETESSAEDSEALENLRLLLFHPKARPHHVAIYALTNIFGHRQSAIASHVGVLQQAVFQLKKLADKYIEEQRQREDAK